MIFTFSCSFSLLLLSHQSQNTVQYYTSCKKRRMGAKKRSDPKEKGEKQPHLSILKIFPPLQQAENVTAVMKAARERRRWGEIGTGNQT